MDRIFHYTTIENLELILSNRTIRLSSLTQMDDITEGGSYDFGSLAKYFYVSSWTDEKEESIPLWHMYTNEMRGVRIEADSDFLKIEEHYPSNRIMNIKNSDIVAFQMKYGEEDGFLRKVEYRDHYNSCIINELGFINSEIELIGRIKPESWSFQSEVRFRVYGLDSKSIYHNEDDSLFNNFFNSIMRGVSNAISYVDVSFDIERIENANFLLGPTATDDDYLRLKNMIEKYIPKHTGQLEKSKIMVRFKGK